MTFVIAALALVACVALAARMALSVPRSGAGSSPRALPSSIPSGAATREKLAAMLPEPRAIVGGAPPVAVGKLLDGVSAGVRVDTSLAVIGVDDRKDAASRELWLASKDALEKNRRPS